MLEKKFMGCGGSKVPEITQKTIHPTGEQFELLSTYLGQNSPSGGFALE